MAEQEWQPVARLKVFKKSAWNGSKPATFYPALRELSDLPVGEYDLYAAAADAEATSGWQPIETAPKDGTDVLLYCGPADAPLLGVGYWAGGEDEQPGWYLWPTAAPFASPWPTHWAPIPSFPIPDSTAA